MSVDSNISITPTTRNFGVGGGGNAIITSGSGTWTAAISDPWINLSATSGAAGYPVAYTVSATTNIGQRVGYVYVSGHVHTVTQDGYEADVSPTQITVEKDGGTGTITLDSPGRYAWDAWPNDDWLSITPTHGVASGTLTYQVAPYNEVATRSGTFTVGDKTVTVFQYGRRMKLSTYSGSYDYLTHVIPITVNALAVTSWTVTPNNSWISVVDAGNGKGGDLVSIAIAENPSWKARTGTVTIGTETYTVTQEGRTELEFSVSPATATAAVSGGNGVFAVTATPDLPWTAASGANWLTILGNTVSGSGTGNVVFNASPNSTLNDRTGKITVTPGDSALNAKTVTVTQPAATAAVSPTGYEFEASGEAVAVTVTVNDIVEWSVAESLDWITVAGSTSRVGPGTVTISAEANNTIYERSGTIKIAGKSFPVSQNGKGVEIEYDNIVFGTDGGLSSVSIHPDGNVSWTAVASDATWITIYQNDSGTGDAEVMYIISPYQGDGSARTGWITVGDKKVYITQRPYDLDITPRAATVTGNAGAGEIGVSAAVGDVWQAIITEPWITIVSGYDAGTGSGTVRFTYTENNTGKTRTGKIIVSGEAYTLTQQARISVAITAAVDDHGGSVSGAGTYTLGETVSLTAVPDAGYEFLYWTGDLGESTQNPLTWTADVAKSVTAHFGALTPEFVSAESSTAGVKLTWKILAWATSYKIYRAPTNEFPTKEIATVAADGSCTYLDTTGTAGTSYFYWVEAIGVDDTTKSKEAVAGTRQKSTVYSSITYTNLKGATHGNPDTYLEGTAVVFTEPSAVTGYTFAGWTPASIAVTATGAQAVYANWTANTYTIAYNANGGSGEMSGTSATYDQNATLSANGFTRANYVFQGWAKTAGAAVAYAAGATVKNLTATQNGVVTLYAVWKKATAVVGIAVDHGGSVTGGGTNEVGTSVVLTAAPDDGYAFAYWTLPDGTESMVNPLTVTVGTANAYTAVFTPLKPVITGVVSDETGVTLSWTNLAWATVYKVYRGASDVPSQGSLVATLPAGTLTFQDMTGDVGQSYWYWIEATGEKDETYCDPVKGMKVKPDVWSAITYTNLKGATHGNPDTYLEGTAVVFTDPSAVTGYTFAGWTPASIATNVTGSQVISANWTANTYTISYNANGGTGTMADTLATYDQRLTVSSNVFTWVNHVFQGWATSATEPVAYVDGASVLNLSSVQHGVVTFYAVWEEIEPAPTPAVDPVGYLSALDDEKLSGLGSTDGSNVWHVVERTDCKSGTTCLEGGLVEDYDEVGTNTVFSAKVKGPGSLTFWWKTSCEADPAGEYTWDRAEFAVDGQIQTRIDGDGDWVQYSVEISGEGTHVLSWSYVTDGYEPEMEGLSSCVWIDGVSWSGESAEEEVLPLENPVISPVDGSTFSGDTCEVSITCSTADAVIYYSTNGRTPGTTDAYRYTAPFTIAKTTTVKAVAVRGDEKSAYVSATITKANISYAIAYDANGGTGTMGPTACTYGTACTLPTCTFAREGYSFAGWATSASGEVIYADATVVSNLTTTADATVTLYATWTYLPIVAPVVTPADGSKFTTDSCSVTITCASADALVYYSTNGRTPSATAANLYAGTFTITNTTTVKAVAVRGTEKSAYVSATITKEVPEFEDAVVDKTVTGLDSNVTVSATWVTESLVSSFGPGKVEVFRQKFGNDLAAALAKPTGKIGPDGEARTVWDDYVAGTDPTDLKSVFSASIEIVGEEIKLSWTPNLNLGSTNRLYRIKSKLNLSDDWSCPPVNGHRFFTVEVALPDGETNTAAPGVVGRVPKEVAGVQLWGNGPYWAECNVGASKPEEYGYYFWWGDTVGYKRVGSSWDAVDGSKTGYSFGGCPTYDQSNSSLQSLGYIDSTGNLVAAHDAATAHLGAPWRMPTDSEMSALINNCTTTWITTNGVYGRLVTGKGDYASKSIFLPAAGGGNGSDLYDAGSYGTYWSSTPDSDGSNDAWYLLFNSSCFFRNNFCRDFGRSVRPLREFAQ